ncbi:hypothetical protein [Hymenobacter terrestris]|uniref:hypothetical protein n=1 Tax=Hymenobacter terrestris TaxID=2748310 RepID=UPI0015A0DD00|nr:hypothetical protein [Hymenobacter terrestris]
MTQFVLRTDKKNKAGLCPVHLVVYFDSVRLKCGTGEMCRPVDWNIDKQKFREEMKRQSEQMRMEALQQRAELRKEMTDLMLKLTERLAHIDKTMALVEERAGGHWGRHCHGAGYLAGGVGDARRLPGAGRQRGGGRVVGGGGTGG